MSGGSPGKDTVETPYIVPWRKALEQADAPFSPKGKE